MAEMKRDHPTLTVLGKYINGRTKIDLRCNVCGKEFSAKPQSLYMKHGCPKCGGTGKRTQEEYENEMASIHPTIQVIGKYRNVDTKVELRCKTCGYEWSATPHSSLGGKGCPVCSGVKKKTHDEFVSEMAVCRPKIAVLGNYENNHTKIKMQCLICGEIFEASPHGIFNPHISHGCPNCKKSGGEIRIDSWLQANGYDFKHEHRFIDCRDVFALPFDFYLQKENIAIEFDGKQHYEPNAFFGGEKAFSILERHDRIKDEYCKAHNIRLIRIPYWDIDRIDEILSKELAN